MKVQSHEDFNRKDDAQGPSDRSFGRVFTVVFALLGLWPLWRHQPIRLWALAVSALFFLVTLTRPSLLHPLNRCWTLLGMLLNRIVSPIVTSLLFFVVVTPIAVIFRRGKDPLRLRFEPQADSYWLPRQPPGPAPETMVNQY